MTGSMRRVLLIVALVVAGASAWQRWRSEQAAPQQPESSTRVPAHPGSGEAGRAPGANASFGRDLSLDESRGGHTLARHVGQSDDALRDRLARERGISAASTYTDRTTAEAVIARTLTQHESRVQAWTSRTGNRPNLALSYRGEPRQIIGRTLRRGAREPVPSTDAVVVLRWAGRDYYVLTSYPEVPR